MSDCDINSVRSPPFSEASTSDNRSDSTGAMPSNGFVEQQASGADAERAAERDHFFWPPLSSSACGRASRRVRRSPHRRWRP
jgi:hypothetical protein